MVLNQSHLRRILAEYSHYYNERRPHQGLDGEPHCHSVCQSSLLLFVDVMFWGASFTITIARRNPYFSAEMSFPRLTRWVAVTATRSDSSSVRLLSADSERLYSLEDLPLLVSGADPYQNLAWSPPKSQTLR